MLNIIAHKVGDTTYVNLDGRHVASTEPDVYPTYLAYRANPTKNLETKLVQLLNPRLALAAKLGLDIVDDKLFLPDTRCPVPASVVPTLEEYAENQWDTGPIVNFIKRVTLNPSEHVRKHLFTYVERHGILLNDDGFLILYKAVREVENVADDPTTVISQEYLSKIRAGLDPSNYAIVKGNNGFYCTKMPLDDLDGYYGNLAELFNTIEAHIPERQTRYTDTWSKTMDIRLRQLVQMPRSKVDPDTQNACSYGLHVGSASYVRSYGGPNAPVFACLVCPSWVVAFPDYDDSKMRVEAYYTYALMDRTEDAWREIEGSYFDTNIAEIEKADLISKSAEIDKVDLSTLTAEQASIIASRARVIDQRLVELEDVPLPSDSGVYNNAPVNAPINFDTNDPTNQLPEPEDDDDFFDEWESDDDDDDDDSFIDDVNRAAKTLNLFNRHTVKVGPGGLDADTLNDYLRYYLDFLRDNPDSDMTLSQFIKENKEV